MNGILVIDKPPHMTSHDVVAIVRRKLGMRRIGHAGTLDPMATGVLIVLVGTSTKLFDKFVGFDKAYEATMKFGVRTASADIEGKVLEERPFDGVTRAKVEKVFRDFTGTIDQIPPMVSAVKHQGQRLYKLARKGIHVDREPRKVKISTIRIVDVQMPLVKFYLECSKGTYVRQVAEDVGEVLGCGACITEIRRTRVGDFAIQDAVNLEDVHEGHLRQWPSA